jgi:D-lactate dehydrogenase
VLITGHQGFFTTEALAAIARTTLDSATAFERDGALPDATSVTAERYTA